MALRVAMLAAECEPWAKTGGLADVVDALARALSNLGDEIHTPVDVFLPRYRSVDVPAGATSRALRVPDPLARGGASDVRLFDVAANGYRLRLVDHPGAFDRDGLYGDATGDYPDNAWRFGILGRATFEALRTEVPRVDVLHLHDWHAGPAAILRDVRYRDDEVIGGTGALLTLHNLAYHGWTPRERLRDLGLSPGDGVVPAGAVGLDLLRAAVERADLVNTVSPTFAREALTPAYGMGLDPVLASLGDRFFGILNGIDPVVWDPGTDPDIAAPYGAADMAGKAACRSDLLGRIGFDPDDPRTVFGMIGRLDPQKGFDLLAQGAPE
ncbi:MAG: glycogen synthase, partial [Chloroflexota bacterium]